MLNTLYAAARLTPRMFVWHLRRNLRDRLIPRLASVYERSLSRRSVQIPLPNFRHPDLLSVARMLEACFAPGNVKTARGIAGGRIEYFDHVAEFGSVEGIDWMHTIDRGNHHLWRQKLSYFGFALPLLADGSEQSGELLDRLADHFQTQISWQTPRVFRDPWNSYAAANRILNLTAGLAIYAAAGGMVSKRQATLAFLRRNVAFLIENPEYEVDFNHLERNWAALALFVMGQPGAMPKLERTLQREIPALVSRTIGTDGYQKERSAMYQAQTLLSLRIYQKSAFLTNQQRAHIAEFRQKAEQVWSDMKLSDGKLSLFNDCWWDEICDTGLGAMPEARSGRVVFPDAGIVRLSNKDVVCMFDAGPIGPAASPGHGHSDFLSFELSIAGQRLVADPGVYHYSDTPERRFRRGAGAHNGPHVEGIEPIAYFGSFRAGPLVAAKLVIDLPPELGSLAVAGVLKADNYRVGRCLVLLPERGMVIVDRWLTRGRGRVRFLLPQPWHARAIGKGNIEIDGPVKVGISALIGEMEGPRESDWSPRFLSREPAAEVIIKPQNGIAAVTCICWNDESPTALASAEILAAANSVLTKSLNF